VVALLLEVAPMVAASQADTRLPDGGVVGPGRGRDRVENSEVWDYLISEQAGVVDRLHRRVAAIDRLIDAAKPQGDGEFHLSLITLGCEVRSLPVSGRNEVIVARQGGQGGALVFRIFDCEGRSFPGAEATSSQGTKASRAKLQRHAVFRSYLQPFWGDYAPARTDQDRIIFLLKSLVGLVDSDFLDRLGRAGERLARAKGELEVASARAPSLPHNVARLVRETAEWRFANARRELDDLLRHTLPAEMGKAADAADDEVAALREQRAHLVRLECQERCKLDELKTRARAAGAAMMGRPSTLFSPAGGISGEGGGRGDGRWFVPVLERTRPGAPVRKSCDSQGELGPSLYR
jgi:hypothetical protein